MCEHENDIVGLLNHIQTKKECIGMIDALVFHTWWKNLHGRCKEMIQCMKCVILLDFKNKLYAGIEIHVDVHAWNYVILLDDKNILQELNCMWLFMLKIMWFCWIFNNKLCAGTETHVDVSYQVIVSAANQVFAVNCVVCSESGVHYWIIVSVANQVFAAELCSLQRISVRCRLVLFAANQVFTAEL